MARRKESAVERRAASKRAGPAAPATKAGARITEHRLSNGLRVLLAERHLDPIVAVMIWYRVGSRNEREPEAGVSHFLEHMMFKGSASFGKGEVDLVTTTLGGNNNAFTSTDHTAYWFELASDRWEKALEIEADRMRSLLLDPAEFEAEKAVVLEELAMGEDDPWRSLTHEVQLALFPRHPYRRPVIGFPDTLKAMSVDAMRDYYARFYHPGNATIVLCGDFEPASALAAVERHFGAIAAGRPYEQADPPRPPVVEPRGERRISIRWDGTGKRLCIAWPTVPVGTPDDYALDLVATVLTGGRLSRLYRRIVLGKGLATSISTHNDTHVESGGFWLYAEAAADAELADLERAIDRELDRLREESVGTAELRRAKRILRASEAYDSETVSDLAEELGEYAVDADWKLALEGIRRVESVQARDVRDCVRRLLTRERRVVGWCVPHATPRAATRVEVRSGSARKTTSRKKAAARRQR